MMIPVMTSFLPPTHTHLYLPSLFALWEAFNSSVIDDRLIDLAGELSEEHSAGKFGLAGGEGRAEWKDVGIWSEAQWTLLVGKSLGSMSASFSLISELRTPEAKNIRIDVPVGVAQVSYLQRISTKYSCCSTTGI
jgi:proteasome activator subunit 4